MSNKKRLKLALVDFQRHFKHRISQMWNLKETGNVYRSEINCAVLLTVLSVLDKAFI